jgi:hypothetical protein
LTLAYAPVQQSVLWFPPRRTPTVLSVTDEQHEYKRAFAATLIGKRVGHGSQKTVGTAAGTSEATYRRWEDPNQPHLPDAWQIKKLAELFGCEPIDLLMPEELNPREWALTRRAAKAAARGATRAQLDEPGPS